VESIYSMNFCECCNCVAFLTSIQGVDREILRRFYKLNRWRAEVVTLTIDRLLQKLWDKTTIFGRS